MLPGFLAPDWNEPLDASERLARTPADATIRGQFFEMIAAAAKAVGRPLRDPARRVSFMKYSVREYMDLAVSTAGELYPGASLREGLRRLGQHVYPAYQNTMIGAAIFALGGKDFERVAALAPKAYDVSLSPGAVTIRKLGGRHLVAELRDVYNFADCLQVGVWEGAMNVCSVSGEIYLKVHGVADVDLEISWR
jgi:uncharacterized protein (TIGR02265 family)